MGHAAWDALETFSFDIKDIKWADAPTVVVAILPVVHAVLPPVTSLTPPFACDIAILKPPLCSTKSIGMATLIANVFGC